MKEGLWWNDLNQLIEHWPYIGMITFLSPYICVYIKSVIHILKQNTNNNINLSKYIKRIENQSNALRCMKEQLFLIYYQDFSIVIHENIKMRFKITHHDAFKVITHIFLSTLVLNLIIPLVENLVKNVN